MQPGGWQARGKNLTGCGLCHPVGTAVVQAGLGGCQGPRQEWRPRGGGCILSGQCNLDTMGTLKVTDPDSEDMFRELLVWLAGGLSALRGSCRMILISDLKNLEGLGGGVRFQKQIWGG